MIENHSMLDFRPLETNISMVSGHIFKNMKINCTEQFKILRLNIYLTFEKSIYYVYIHKDTHPLKMTLKVFFGRKLSYGGGKFLIMLLMGGQAPMGGGSHFLGGEVTP